MAQIFRKQPTAAPERPKTRPVANAPAAQPTNAFGRLRNNYNDIMAELRKVTWPSREETRNLTIVVIGISVALGAVLGGLDYILYTLYSLINPS
jgi:preprotein translocase subunit SecE